MQNLNNIILKMLPLTGLPISQVATKIGVSTSQLSLYLNGKTSLNRNALDKLLQLSGLNVAIFGNRIDLAKKVAEKLLNIKKDVNDVRKLSKGEMASLSGEDAVNNFRNVTLSEFEHIIDSNVVDYASCYPYFQALVIIFMTTPANRITSKVVNSSFGEISNKFRPWLALNFVNAINRGPLSVISAVAGSVIGAFVYYAEAQEKHKTLKDNWGASVVELALQIAKSNNKIKKGV